MPGVAPVPSLPAEPVQSQFEEEVSAESITLNELLNQCAMLSEVRSSRIATFHCIASHQPETYLSMAQS